MNAAKRDSTVVWSTINVEGLDVVDMVRNGLFDESQYVQTGLLRSSVRAGVWLLTLGHRLPPFLAVKLCCGSLHYPFELSR